MKTASLERPRISAHWRERGQGLLLTLVIALVSFLVWWSLKGTWFRVSALWWALFLSIISSNAAPRLASASLAPGVEFVSGRLLRTAIALLGMTVSATLLLKLGGMGVALVLANLSFSFLFGVLACRYVLRMPLSLATLIAGGTAICGASAIAAIGPAIRAKGEEIGTALAVVSLFGLMALLTYPALFAGPLHSFLGADAAAYGLWVGMGIHDTAQVVAAASQVDGALGMAVMAKSVRIFMIVPVVFASLLAMRVLRRRATDETGPITLAVPWFAVGFLALSLVGTLAEESALGAQWRVLKEAFVSPAVTFLLAWGFAGVGLKVKLASILSLGWTGFLGGLLVATTAGASAFLLTSLLWL